MKRNLLFILIIMVMSQSGITQDNELHAFDLDHSGVYPLKNMLGSPLYANYNISAEAAPQNEPTVRISRSDPNIVVAAWRDFRLGWEEPDVVRRIGYAWSEDGGLTWSESMLLPDPLPDHLSQSDPVLTSDASGHFYLSSTSRKPVVNYNRDMLLYKSTDNGQTFELHAVAVPGSGNQGEDKEWIFCDPVPENPTYDNIMIVWRSFGASYGIKFRKSDAGGGNWGPTVKVGDNSAGQGANVTTGTDGTIHVVWWDGGIRYDRSFNSGISFGQDTYISTYGQQSNTAFPFICTDYSEKPSRGNIYITWSDRRGGTDDIWFQRSTDGGDSWLDEPIRVNDVATNQQYWPTIQCNENGRIIVAYYDERQGPGIMNAYMAFSDDQGESWTNTRLSDESFSGSQPNSNVRFGDYIHIDSWGGKTIPVWTDDRDGDYKQEIYTAVNNIIIGIDPGAEQHQGLELFQNFPNPFSGETDIRFSLEQDKHVRAEIFNATGQVVDVLLDTELTKGDHRIRWSAASVPAGLYYLKLSTPDGISRISMLCQ